MIPTFDSSEVPHLTTDQMVEVDRVMIEDYGIDLVRMMENAGRALASLARRLFLNGDAGGRRIVVMAGTGGNGGGALVAARRLHNYGATVRVLATRGDDAFTPVPREQLAIIRQMGIDVDSKDDLAALGDPAALVALLRPRSPREAPLRVPRWPRSRGRFRQESPPSANRRADPQAGRRADHSSQNRPFSIEDITESTFRSGLAGA